MYEIDAEVLISLVESKPVLWDKTLEVFKDRNAKRNAWSEVCLALEPNFDVMDNKEKNLFGKEVIKRWTNLRDSYAKSKKSTKDEKKSGSAAKKVKKYVFTDQMQFLNKLYQVRETTNSLEENPAGDNSVLAEEDIDDPESTVENGGPAAPIPTVQPPATKRKHKKQDEFELKLLKVLEPKVVSSKMSFFQSLMPHLEKYNDNEFLQFQMGVLKVVEQINMQKQGLFMPIQNPTVVNHPPPPPPPPPQQQFSSIYFPNLNQQGTSNQVAPLPIQHTPYPNEQYSAQMGPSNTQMTIPIRPPPPSHSSTRVNSSPLLSSSARAAHKRKINDKEEGNKLIQTAQEYYQEFSQDSRQSEVSNSPSPHTSISANSPLSETLTFDFGDDYQLSSL